MDTEASARLLYLAGKANQAYDPPAESESIVHLHDHQDIPRGFVEYGPKRIIFSFMGTVDLEDAGTDARFFKEPLLGHWVHAGFRSEYLALWSQIHNVMYACDPETEIWITGHSLGAAIATLVALGIKTMFGVTPTIATFGCPRVGTYGFAKHFDALFPDAVRVVHDSDIVPRIPKFFYWHTGGLLHLSDDGKIIHPARSLWNACRNALKIAYSDVRGKALSDHHMPNYLAAVTDFHRNNQE